MTLWKNTVISIAAAIGCSGCCTTSYEAYASDASSNNIQINSQEVKAIQMIIDQNNDSQRFNINNNGTLITNMDKLLSEKFKLMPVIKKNAKKNGTSNSKKSNNAKTSTKHVIKSPK